MLTENDFTRVNSDSNGNPRYAIHFLSCEPECWKDYSETLTSRYGSTVKLMNKVGGKKFHNKQYGGGIVFQSYSLPETIKRIEEIKANCK